MRRLALALAAMALLAAGCGDDGDGTETGATASGELIVSAASSLQEAFTAYAEDAFPDDEVRQSFAGSDELAAQIRQGLRPDVYAAADTELPQRLFEEGLVERPQTFAGNELVIAVPSESEIQSLKQLGEPGVDLVIGDPSVPVGSYTREVLARLPATQRDAILANVRSEEPEVAAIVGKLTQGAADAGFVYVTDIAAAGDDLRAIELASRLQPVVAYGVAVVKDAPNPALAREFVAGLLDGAGARALRAAGFLPPP